MKRARLIKPVHVHLKYLYLIYINHLNNTVYLCTHALLVKYYYIFYYDRHHTAQTDSNPGSESPSGPLKARKKLGARKASEENLLDDGGSSSGKVLRPASSAEDLHTLNIHSSPKVQYNM